MIDEDSAKEDTKIYRKLIKKYQKRNNNSNRLNTQNDDGKITKTMPYKRNKKQDYIDYE